jgi:CRISPR/Cas system-associated protein Cas10 (large subunit of type III CRISPR-Cas system)
LGGDDVMMVVPASVAMDVALTIAKEFEGIS